MSATHWQRVQALFAAALEQPPERRAAYVAAAVEDPDVSREVLALLLAHEGRGRFDSVADELRGLGSAVASVPLAQLVDRLRPALAGRYTIERELGHGGMAFVFLARDLKHGRPVAIKVLRPEIALALGAERFLREIQIAARLQHPNILSLHDSGEADGALYYVMPFVEGESLRERLEREGQLPIDDALRITRTVADALSYAHSRDVVHRDIKPENILLAGDHCVVADFGIARAITAAGGERLTETGIAVGTPAYMSPEQAAGKQELDGRSDVYSLGCVLYEMLAGDPPFTGLSVQAILARKVLEPPPSIRPARRTVPGSLVQALERALATAPADRFATAQQFAAALLGAPARTRRWRTPLVATSALVLLAAAAWWLVDGRLPTPRTSAGLAPKSIAVLYFENLSPDTADAYLADGLTVELIDRLGASERLRVKPRSAVQRYRGRDASPIALGNALGVTYLVDGTLRRADSRIRVTAELVRVATGERIWGRSYDRSATDLLDIETSIALALAREIAGRLLPEEQARLAAQPTSNPQAYEHFLRGNYELARRTDRSFRLALSEYQAALQADPAFGTALARMAYAYGLSRDRNAFPEQRPESVIARGLTLADRALALDSGLSDGWLARAHLLRYVYPETYLGIREALRRAIDLNPRNAEAYHRLGEVVRSFGEDSLAVVFFDSALALDPYRPITLLSIAEVRWTQRRFEEALHWMDSAAVVDPGFVFTDAYRAHLELHLDDTLAARGHGEAALRTGPRDAYAQSAMAILELRRGHKAAARALLDRALARYEQEDTVHVDDAHGLALGLVALGDVDRAVAVLSRTRPGIYLRYMLRWPEFDSIRSDPRFERLAGPVRHPVR